MITIKRLRVYESHDTSLADPHDTRSELTREEYVEERHDEGLRVDERVARVLGDEDRRDEAGDVGGEVGEVVDRLHLQQLAEVQHQAQLAVPVSGGGSTKQIW